MSFLQPTKGFGRAAALRRFLTNAPRPGAPRSSSTPSSPINDLSTIREHVNVPSESHEKVLQSIASLTLEPASHRNPPIPFIPLDRSCSDSDSDCSCNTQVRSRMVKDQTTQTIADQDNSAVSSIATQTTPDTSRRATSLPQSPSDARPPFTLPRCLTSQPRTSTEYNAYSPVRK